MNVHNINSIYIRIFRPKKVFSKQFRECAQKYLNLSSLIENSVFCFFKKFIIYSLEIFLKESHTNI
jgi:hypothetical protein